MKKSLANGFKWNLIDTFVSNATNLIGMVVLSRLIEPKDFGMMAMLIIFIALSEILINSGFSQALVQKNKNVTNRDCNTVFTVNFIASILLYIFFYLSSSKIAYFYDIPELSFVIKVFFLTFILNSFSLVPKALFSIQYDFLPQSLINIISTVIGMSISVIAAFYGFGYWALVINPLLKSAASSILFLIVSNWKPILKIDKESFKELFFYGSKLMVASILNVLTLNLHNVFIGRYFNSSTLGYYTQSNNLSNIISKNITLIVQKLSFPMISSIKEDDTKVIESFRKFLLIVSFVSLPLLFGFASISKEFVYIVLGEKWLPMVDSLIVLSLAKAISPIGMFSISVISALGRSDLVLKTDIIKLPLSLTILFITVPNGILAVAYGQLLLSIVYLIMNAYYTGKLLSFGIIEQLKCIYKIGIASIIMFVVNYNLVFNNVYHSILLKLLIGVLVFISICYALNVKFVRQPKTLSEIIKF